MDLAAVSRRVLATLEADAPLKAAIREFRWGASPIYEYGERRPLCYVSPGRNPIQQRRAIGSGGDPDRHHPEEVQAAMEVTLVTRSHHKAEAAQAEIWRLLVLAENALARNNRLLDANGANPLAAVCEQRSYRREGPGLGGPVEGATISLIVTDYEWLGEALAT